MIVYVVRSGESLSSVARRFSTTAEELAALNALSSPPRLVPGLALAIPGGAEQPRREAVVNACAYPPLPQQNAAEQLAHFTFFCPFSCRMTAEGGLAVPDDAALVSEALAGGVSALLTVTNLSENGGFSGDLAHAVLSDSRAQDALLSRILAHMDARGYRGVFFHLEYVYPFDRERYTAFLRRAEELLHARGRLLVTALAPKESESQGGPLCAAHDYDAHALLADWVVLTTYDWGHSYSEPRPVSPLGRIRAVLDYAVEHIPRGKILMGISNYACNWTLPWREGGAASLLPNGAAANLAIAAGAEIRYDACAAASHFRYRDDAGTAHEVWFEDVRSFCARFALAEEYALGGLSYWTVNAPNRAMLLAQQERFSAVKLI